MASARTKRDCAIIAHVPTTFFRSEKYLGHSTRYRRISLAGNSLPNRASSNARYSSALGFTIMTSTSQCEGHHIGL